jgi:hypothetical protein
MQIDAVPQWQGAVNELAQGMSDGCLALADLTARILGRPVNLVTQSREIFGSPDQVEVLAPVITAIGNLLLADHDG